MAAAIPVALFQVRPLTAESVAHLLTAVRTAEYRQVPEEVTVQYAEHLRKLRDTLLEDDLPRGLHQRHLDGLLIIFKEFGIMIPDRWTQNREYKEGEATPSVKKEIFRGEKHFDLLVKASLVRRDIKHMSYALSVLQEHSGSGLSGGAAALFAGMSWTHQNQVLAEAAARARPSFFRAELDFCLSAFPEISRLDRLFLCLAHTHTAGVTLWSEQQIPAWDQFHAWLMSSVIMPLVQIGVPVAELEAIICDDILPAAERQTLSFANFVLEESEKEEDDPLDILTWSQAVPTEVLSAKVRKLTSEAHQHKGTYSMLESGASVSDLKLGFQICLKTLVAHPLALNWELRAAELSACPLHLAVPGLCPMNLTCPLDHHEGHAWWDASTYVFGNEPVSIATLRKRLGLLAPPLPYLDAPLRITGTSVPQVKQQGSQGNQGNSNKRTHQRGKGGKQNAKPAQAAQAPEPAKAAAAATWQDRE